MSEPPYQSSSALGKDRRSSVRRPIRVQAELSFRTERNLPCEITDFCPEGVFVTYSSATDRRLDSVRLAAEDSVGLSFPDPFTKREHRMQVAVKRLLDGAFGGMFTDGNTAAITSLLRICGASTNAGHGTKSQPESASLLMRQSERVIRDHVEPLVAGYIDALPDLFDEAINHAATNNEKADLADSIVDFKRQSNSLISRYFNHLSDGLVPRLDNDATGPKEQASASLSLIDKAEFEDWLTLKVMVTKAEAAFRDELLKVKMRFDSVGIQSVKGYPNPLGPALFCYSLRDTLIQMDLPVVAERLCLTQFEKSVVHKLEDMYKAINEMLVRQGILPDLDLSKFASGQRPAPSSPGQKVSQEAAEDEPASEVPDAATAIENAPAPANTVDSAAIPPAVNYGGVPKPALNQEVLQAENQLFSGQQVAQARAAQASPTAQQGSFGAETAEAASALANSSPFAKVGSYLASARESVAAVNNLLANLRRKRSQTGVVSREEATFPAAGEAPSYQNEEVIGSLHQVQTNPVTNSSADAVADPSGLRERLANLVDLQQVESKSFTPQQDKSLDVVDRFFASLLKNRKLTEVSKTQIKGMEIPLLKLLLKNPDFFQDTSHPARKLIDRLAQAGAKGGRISPSQMERINSLVVRVQAEQDDDPVVFEEALAEVDEIVERQNLLYRRNVERVMAAAEGEQKIEEAKKAVAKAIHERVANKKVPKAVATLLSGGWRDLLNLTYLRQGPDSQAWQDYLNVVDMLIRVGSDPDYKFNVPEVLKVIQDGLATISSNHMPSGFVRDEIKGLLVRKPETEPPELVEIPVTTEHEVEPDIGLLKEARERGLKRWLARAQKLKIGDWLRLERDKKEPELIRLVWVGKSHARYVFVNHQGMKVIDLDALTLAAYLQKGIAISEPDVDKPVVDESLDNMVKDLYEQLSHVGTHDELTGLMLRKEFERQLLVQQSAMADDETMTCLLVSLEQFRLINDSVGNEAGDNVLKELAFQFKARLPGKALLCRYSGDEFMLSVVDSATQWLAIVRDVIENFELTHQGTAYKVSAGIGYIETKAGVLELRQLLRAAEDSCRIAKKKGTGKTEAFNFDQQQIKRRDAIALKVASLDKGLDEERLLLRCQKIIPMRKTAKLGVQHEILLSIYDDLGHLIPVSDFIRAAEDYKRVQEVDRWVVGRTLDWMLANRSRISQISGISINLSGHSLNDESLLEFIFNRLTENDCPLEKVTFEITEAAAIAKPHDVAEFIRELQEYGCRFCLGHYGTGNVSYKLLKELPVDMIKIDGSFIRELATDKNDLLMVRSMIEMAHYLRREVVAPLVESKEAFAALKQTQIDYAQGYFIERPKSLVSLWASTA